MPNLIFCKSNICHFAQLQNAAHTIPKNQGESPIIGVPIINSVHMPSNNSYTDGPGADRLASRDDFSRNVWCLMGLPIDAVTMDDAVRAVATSVEDRQRLSLVTPNVNWLVSALANPEMRRMVIDADLSVADGMPLVAMAKQLGMPITERVAGSDLFERLHDQPTPIRVFFFGGRDGAAEKAFETLRAAQNSALKAAGWLNPGFGDVATMSTPQIRKTINDSNPDFVVVALGAQKGQAWIDYNQSHLDPPILSHLGAVVDFTAGSVERAPEWMANNGLEWAWRIKADPALWRRYGNDAKALAGLGATRFAPQLSIAQWLAPKGSATSSTGIIVDELEGRTRITLSGEITAATIEMAIDPFRDAANTDCDVVLSLAHANRIDQRFLGLCLMLEKHKTRQGKEIFLDRPSAKIKSLFENNAMAYASV